MFVCRNVRKKSGWVGRFLFFFVCLCVWKPPFFQIDKHSCFPYIHVYSCFPCSSSRSGYGKQTTFFLCLTSVITKQCTLVCTHLHIESILAMKFELRKLLKESLKFLPFMSFAMLTYHIYERMVFVFHTQLLKALFFTNMASHSDLPSALSSRKPGKATRLTSCMKPGLYHDCFVAPYTQYTQSLTSMGPKLASSSETSETDSSG